MVSPTYLVLGIRLPAEDVDSSFALTGLYTTLEGAMVELRKTSFTTFTSKRRLDEIRSGIKAARGHVDALQEILVAQVKANDLLRAQAAARAQAAQQLALEDLYR